MTSALAFAVLSVFATLGGGVISLRADRRMHLVLGFSAGVLLGLVLFDLLPEVVEMSEATLGEIPLTMVFVAAGFMGLHIVERGLGLHHAHEADFAEHDHRGQSVGLAAALVLAAHAFVDGLSIGVAFAVDARIGVAVGIAVVAHRFADGLSAVAVMRIRGNSRRQTVGLLVLSALAPIAGVLVAETLDIGEHGLALVLAVFAGFLLYLATNDILPEAHRRNRSRWTLVATVGGMVLMGLVVTYG